MIEKISFRVTNISDLISKINEIIDHLNNQQPKIIETTTERWKPKEGEQYYHIDDMLEVENMCWDGYEIDIMRYRSGNLFRTEYECELARDKVKQLLLSLGK